MVGRSKSNSAPRSDCRKRSVKREHYTRKNGCLKPKKSFKTKQEADAWIERYKMKGYVSYMCGVCEEWHIGLKL